MADFNNIIVTKVGQKYLEKAFNGEGKIIFDTVVTSNNIYDRATILELTEITPVQSSKISKITHKDTIQYEFTAYFENSQLYEDYYINSIGIYGIFEDNDSNKTTLLYAVASVSDEGKGIYVTSNTKNSNGVELDLILKLDNTDAFNLEIDKSAVATFRDIEAVKIELSENIECIETEVSDARGVFETLAERLNQLDINIFEYFSSTDTYITGDIRIYNNKLYRCKTDITEAHEFDETEWEETNIIKAFESCLMHRGNINNNSELNTAITPGYYYIGGLTNVSGISGNVFGTMLVLVSNGKKWNVSSNYSWIYQIIFTTTGGIYFRQASNDVLPNTFESLYPIKLETQNLTMRNGNNRIFYLTLKKAGRAVNIHGYGYTEESAQSWANTGVIPAGYRPSDTVPAIGFNVEENVMSTSDFMRVNADGSVGVQLTRTEEKCKHCFNLSYIV